MSPSINLLFGVHNHQPVGNFEAVFKKADQQCYRPFISMLYNYPEIKTTLHFSGSLIDWLLKNDPGLLEKVKEMVKRRQVEILTGGYYEPILSIIPEKDRLGQIKMLSDFIKDYFDYTPQGMWVGERVWEPHLVKSIVASGVKYILLDDYHFKLAGIKDEDLLGYYITEDEGQTLAAFPISKNLRYTIPFSKASQPIKYLKSLASEDVSRVATIVDDGEKFGLWPGTHKWVYGKKWLERFFQLLIENQDWLQTQTVSEYMQKHKALGSLCLPPASYEEMMSWSGGFFRNFLVKYPEVNNLHKRMLYVSEKINKTKGVDKEARKHLYMGQCNCPYWHGVFGGVYLGHLRHNAYKNLITAQTLAEKKDKPSGAETETVDFDKDGTDELVIKNAFLNVFVAPMQGGAIFELDYLPKSINLMDAMTRKPESYHEKIKTRVKKSFRLKKKRPKSIHDLLGSKEKGLENLLLYDSYRRLSLLDHFFQPNLSFKAFKHLRSVELGNFLNGPYSVTEEKEGQNVSVTLQRDGTLNCKGKEIPLTIKKNLSLNNKDAQLSVEYNLENLSGKPLDIIFAVEFNISAAGQEHPNELRCVGKSGLKIYSLKEDVEAKDIGELHLQDAISGTETAFYFDKKPNLWAHPLETISASESGFERNYQQTVILPHWQIKLEKTWQARLEIRVDKLKN
ncbi:MAG: DUF1926 domain-containing protein [Candidatus Omnitrophica bacterium]|nr:DUF1926 domain-containing protein [Candidatus Omnitrophota bacterium]